MNFKHKNYDEIFEDLLNTALEENLLTYQEKENFKAYISHKKDIENFYIMLLSIFSEVFEDVYDEEQNIYDSLNINKATGVDLDNLGSLVGVSRPNSSRAYVDVTLQLGKQYSEDITLPAGLKLSTVDGIMYSTIEQAYFPAGSTSTENPIACYADEYGTSSRINAGELTKIVTQLTGVSLRCTNLEASSGGSDALPDEEYREYIRNWFKIHQKGNEWAYRNYFANFEGLDGYKLAPLWDGTGTIKIVLDPGSNYQCQKVYDEIQEDVALFDDDLFITPAIKKVIDIYAVINVDIDVINPYSTSEKEDIKNKIVTAIKLYIDGGYRQNGEYYKGLSIGEDFIPHKCAVFLDNEITELKNINFNYPSDFIQITDDEIASAGNIEVEML